MGLAAGTRLGPYEVVAAVGIGGMGEVHRARDTRLDRDVAIKLLRSDLGADPGRRARFQAEARAIAGLNHPHICTLHDIGEHEGSLFLVMEYLEGRTLAERLASGPMLPGEAIAAAIEVADALAAAHRQGMVHRDLKPANVMLTSSGAKLLDFGLAHLTQPSAGVGVDATESSISPAVGTVPYMAPEQVEGRATDARTDLFAFGALLYEMLSRRRAFEGSSPAGVMAAILDRDPPPLASLRPDLPPALDHLVRRCLAKRPDERWHSAHDAADELRSIAASCAGRRGADNTRLTIVAAAILVAALGVGVALVRTLPGTSGQGHSPGPRPRPALPFTDGPAGGDRAALCDGLADRPKRYTSNARACDLYLEGRNIQTASVPIDWRRAIPVHLAAVAEDPNFALPYVSLAWLYWHMYVSAEEPKSPPREEAHGLATEAVGKALALDPDNGPALAIRATLQSDFGKDLEAAERDYARALLLSPRDPLVLEMHSFFLVRRGRLDAALRDVNLLIAIDPTVAQNYCYRGRLYYFMHRYDESAREYRKALAIDPRHVYTWEWSVLTYLAQGLQGRARESVERAGSLDPSGWWAAAQVWVDVAGGKGARSEERMKGQRPWASAVYHAMRGDRAAALSALRTLGEENPGTLAFCYLTHVFDKYRTDPDFVALLEQHGFKAASLRSRR